MKLIRFVSILVGMMFACLALDASKNKSNKVALYNEKKNNSKKKEKPTHGQKPTGVVPKKAKNQRADLKKKPDVTPKKGKRKRVDQRKNKKKLRARKQNRKNKKNLLAALPQNSLQGTQQAGPLIGTSMTENAQSGQSVALSADGTTLAIGAPSYNNALGGVWIFTRSGTSTWSQQAGPLSGSAAYDFSYQGISLSLSANGNVLAVGAPGYNSTGGAVWLFIRDELGWKEFAGPLSGSSADAEALQGFSVCLSSDGNTLAVGGPGQGSGNGAVWLFGNSPIGWTQQSMLTINNTVGSARQGSSLAFSQDGNFLAVGAPQHDDNKGAVWIFMNSPIGWVQQAGPLQPSSFSGTPGFGMAVALSGDGSTLAFGGPFNSAAGFEVGGVTIFTRTGSSWSLQTNSLVAQPYQGYPAQGNSLSLSADGNTLAVGGPMNNSAGAYVGGSWIFTRSGTNWTQQPGTLIGKPFAGESHQGSSIALSSDGTTLAVGGPDDNGNELACGAVWIFS